MCIIVSGVEVGVFGVEGSTPTDRTLQGCESCTGTRKPTGEKVSPINSSIVLGIFGVIHGTLFIVRAPGRATMLLLALNSLAHT